MRSEVKQLKATMRSEIKQIETTMKSELHDLDAAIRSELDKMAETNRALQEDLKAIMGTTRSDLMDEVKSQTVDVTSGLDLLSDRVAGVGFKIVGVEMALDGVRSRDVDLGKRVAILTKVSLVV